VCCRRETYYDQRRIDASEGGDREAPVFFALEAFDLATRDELAPMD